jgi:hypothetical protein
MVYQFAILLFFSAPSRNRLTPDAFWDRVIPRALEA